MMSRNRKALGVGVGALMGVVGVLVTRQVLIDPDVPGWMQFGALALLPGWFVTDAVGLFPFRGGTAVSQVLQHTLAIIISSITWAFVALAVAALLGGLVRRRGWVIRAGSLFVFFILVGAVAFAASQEGALPGFLTPGAFAVFFLGLEFSGGFEAATALAVMICTSALIPAIVTSGVVEGLLWWFQRRGTA